MGSLLPAPYKMGTYEFFDAKNQLQVTLRLTGTAWAALKFDIFDKNRTLVAKLIVLLNIRTKHLYRFELYAPDEKTILATGVSNLFGTHHTVLGEEEKVKQFIDFGCGLILSHAFSPEEEQAMLQFMLSRIS